MNTTMTTTPVATAPAFPDVRRVLVRRWKMATRGNAYAYEVLVALTDCPEHIQRTQTHFTVLDSDFNTRYVSFADATQSAEHVAMAPGFDRYDEWLIHERAAKVEARRLAAVVFPELNEWPADALPLLWASYDRELPHAADAWLEIE